MRIALDIPFEPNRPSAERELAMRMGFAAAAKGWTARTTSSVAEIEAFAPDLVLALHHDLPKRVAVPTFGCLWNPPAHFEDDADRLARVLSYDGFLTAGSGMRRWIESLLFPTHRTVVAGDLYPSTHDETLAPRIDGASRLFYVGSNWDGRRFERLFTHLAEAGVLAVYGPAAAWSHNTAYAGTLPFDGRAVLTTANAQGIGLCLHLPGHRASGIPNMRVFELAAAGVLAICDRHPFVVEHFGDCVFTVDTDGPEDAVACQIVDYVRWARAHPEEARAMAAGAQAVFRERFTLDRAMDGWQGLLDTVRRSTDAPATDSVRFVVDTCGAEADSIARTVASARAQSNGAVDLAILQDDGRPAPDKLRTALSSAGADWFGILTPGTVLFPDHVATLLDTAKRSGAAMVYATAVNGDGARWAVFPNEVIRRGDLPGNGCPVPVDAFLVHTSLINDRLLQMPDLGAETALHLIRHAARRAAPVASWRTTLAVPHPPAKPSPALSRVERLDPDVWASSGDRRARPTAPPTDIGAPVLESIPVLRDAEDFAALDPARPIFVYGASRGGRLVQLELMKWPDLRIAGFLDGRATGPAWDLPVLRPTDVPPETLSAATIVVASQHVADIVGTLVRLGRFRIVNAYPYILGYTTPPARQAGS